MLNLRKAYIFEEFAESKRSSPKSVLNLRNAYIFKSLLKVYSTVSTVYSTVYHKFYRKQYPLPAVSRLASRGEQWLHVCYIYTDRSQERLEKKSS